MNFIDGFFGVSTRSMPNDLALSASITISNAILLRSCSFICCGIALPRLIVSNHFFILYFYIFFALTGHPIQRSDWRRTMYFLRGFGR